MRKLFLAVLAVLSTSGCAGYLPPPAGPPPVIIIAEANEFGARVDVNFDWATFLATRSSPKIEYQNSVGGWEQIRDRGWIDLPYSQGGLNLRVTPNGHFESCEATIDGALFGNGLHFGFGAGAKDNGKHLLRITVRRSYDPDLGDPVPYHYVESRTFNIIVFYKASY